MDRVTQYRLGMLRALNYFGRFLVTGGILLLLFVGYQLWGTGIYESRQQSNLLANFTTQLHDVRRANLPVSGTTTTTVPPVAPPSGAPVGIIRIPKIELERTLVQGTTVTDLRTGPGHYPESPLPGQLGNSAIAGHRTTYGAPFNRLDELVPGDEIVTVTLNGTFRYRVTEQRIVNPRDLSVLDPTPDATLTLTTCNPKFSARERLVIKARLDVVRSPAPAIPAVNPRPPPADADLAGTRESRGPVLWSGLIAAGIGGIWWFAFHRRKRWYVWIGGVVPFLAAYAMFCFYLERVLPPGF